MKFKKLMMKNLNYNNKLMIYKKLLIKKIKKQK